MSETSLFIMRARQAFTVIELLIVTAIVAILLGIGLAVFRSAIASAKSRSCLANLQQIGMGLTLYAQDHEDRYPPYVFENVGVLSAKPKEFKAALRGYKVDEAQFYCPLDVHARTAFQGESYTHLDTSYSMSIDYYNHGKVQGDGFVFSPSATSDLTRINLFDDMSELITDENGNWSRIGPHGDRYNVLRADGAVVNIPIVQP